jgi:Putative metallopeptidase
VDRLDGPSRSYQRDAANAADGRSVISERAPGRNHFEESHMLTLSRRTVTALAGSVGLSAMLGISSASLLGSAAADTLPRIGTQRLAEFVSGNMLFVLCHEIAHAAITQMGLPVLGRAEDAADSFAALRMIRLGSDFSHRVLADAAQGWFLSNRRDQTTGENSITTTSTALICSAPTKSCV